MTGRAAEPGPWVAVGPPAVGLRASAEPLGAERVSGRHLYAAPELHDTPGRLGGGVAAGLLLGAARLADPFDAPPTSVDVWFAAPAPVDERLAVLVHAPATAEYELELALGDTTLGTAEVALAGHALQPRAYDLQALGTVPLPAAVENERTPSCWVCGPDSPTGLGLVPQLDPGGPVVIPYIPEPAHRDARGHLHPVVVCALLSCPTRWAGAALLGRAEPPPGLLSAYHVRFFAPASAYEPLRVVAVADGLDADGLHARSALVDEDGIVYATAAAVWRDVGEPVGHAPAE